MSRSFHIKLSPTAIRKAFPGIINLPVLYIYSMDTNPLFAGDSQRLLHATELVYIDVVLSFELRLVEATININQKEFLRGPMC